MYALGLKTHGLKRFQQALTSRDNQVHTEQFALEQMQGLEGLAFLCASF